VIARPFSRAAVVAATLVGVSCAPRLMKLPTGAGQPASDAQAALAEATTACSGVTALSAEIGVSGSVGSQGLRGRLLVGVAAPASARLEAVAPFGQPIFIFVARGDEATLLLPRDERVLEHGKPAAVLEAVAGVPLDAPGLRDSLTGCAKAGQNAMARAFGDKWRSISDGTTEIYLQRDAAASPWRVAAVVHLTSGRPDWRREYRDVQRGMPRSVRLASADRSRFDLRLALSQVDLNPALGAEVFQVQIPPSAQPISLDELRRARPGIRKD